MYSLTFMKRLFSLLLIFSIIIAHFSASFSTSAQDEDDNYFIVTAYYSPLPNQEHYLTGNYEDEKILNGQWIAGASGKKVFSGMLAAPGKYRFGTKIHLDGLGIGAVEDRGWAIVPAGQRWYSYDRIDVWMWYGDEWLQRALFWGKRKVYGYVIDPKNQVTLDYKNVPSPKWATDGLQEAKKQLPHIFDTSLGKWSEPELINELQSLLSDLWYLDSNYQTGTYDALTIDAVFDFQIHQEILSKNTDPGAGSYGPKTRASLKIAYQEYLEEEQKRNDFFKKFGSLQEEAFSNAESHVISLEKPVYWEISPRVRELQKTLSKLGYFNHKDTAIFWIKTQNALIEYQIWKNLISQTDEIWAGTFWPKTRAQFTKDLNDIYIKDLVEKHSLQEEYNLYIIDLNDNKISSEESNSDVSIEVAIFRI